MENTIELSANNIIASPQGYVMSVVSVDSSREVVICKMINAPFTREYLMSEVRFISTHKRPLIQHESIFEQLIEERNIIVANYIPTRTLRRVPTSSKPRARREKTLQELIMAASSAEEIQAIIARAGLYPVKEEELEPIEVVNYTSDDGDNGNEDEEYSNNGDV